MAPVVDIKPDVPFGKNIHAGHYPAAVTPKTVPAGNNFAAFGTTAVPDAATGKVQPAPSGNGSATRGNASGQQRSRLSDYMPVTSADVTTAASAPGSVTVRDDLPPAYELDD